MSFFNFEIMVVIVVIVVVNRTSTLLKPRKMHVSTHFLNAVTTDHPFAGPSLDSLRSFITQPSLVPTLGTNPLQLKQELDVLDAMPSRIFEISPPSLLVSALDEYARLNHSLVEVVSVTNATGTKQGYHLVLSDYFTTDVPLDGVIEGLGTLKVPVRLNVK